MSEVLSLLQVVLLIGFMLLFYFKYTAMNKQVVHLSNQIDTQNEPNQDLLMKEVERNFETLKEDLEGVVASTRAQLDQLYKTELGALGEVRQEHVLIIEHVIEQLNLDQAAYFKELDHYQHKIGQDFSDMKSTLDAHVALRDTEHDLWVANIKEISSEPQKAVEMLESALSQFPYSKTLFSTYLETLAPFMSASNQTIKKRTVEKLNRASRIYLDHCSVGDWDYAIKTHNEILKLGNKVMADSYQERKAAVEETLSELEVSLKQLESDQGVEASLLGKIESVEKRLDKALLEREPSLLARYERLSKRLITHYSQDQQRTEKDIQDYNLKAVEQIKAAYDDHLLDERTFKAGYNLDSFITRLSGWDNQYLKSETQTYFQTVYAEMFGKLDPTVKPRFTRNMLTSKKKAM